MQISEIVNTYAYVLHRPSAELSHPERAIRALLLEHTQIELMVYADTHVEGPPLPEGKTLPERVAWFLTGVPIAPDLSGQVPA